MALKVSPQGEVSSSKSVLRVGRQVHKSSSSSKSTVALKVSPQGQVSIDVLSPQGQVSIEVLSPQGQVSIEVLDQSLWQNALVCPFNFNHKALVYDAIYLLHKLQ